MVRERKRVGTAEVSSGSSSSLARAAAGSLSSARATAPGAGQATLTEATTSPFRALRPYRWICRRSTAGLIRVVVRLDVFDRRPAPDRRQAALGDRSTRDRPPRTGHPETHHVEARVFKDLFPRYRTMQGLLGIPGGPAGTATACRSNWRWKRELGPQRQTRHRTPRRRRVQRPLPRVGGPPRRRVRDAAPSGWATGSTCNTRTRPLSPECVDSRLVDLQTLGSRWPAVEDYRVAPYCTRCGGDPVRPRGRPGLRDRGRPFGHRPVPAVRQPLLGISDVDLLIWTTTRGRWCPNGGRG